MRRAKTFDDCPFTSVGKAKTLQTFRLLIQDISFHIQSQANNEMAQEWLHAYISRWSQKNLLLSLCVAPNMVDSFAYHLLIKERPRRNSAHTNSWWGFDQTISWLSPQLPTLPLLISEENQTSDQDRIPIPNQVERWPKDGRGNVNKRDGTD